MEKLPWFDQQLDGLVQRFTQSSLHHGILLIGKKGVGKKQILHNVAHLLLCENNNACGQCQACRLFSAGNHPDFILPEYENTIGVDLIRQCINQLSTKSHLGGPMLLVLQNIEAMTTASANALLKTLEEPTPNTFILMSTDSTTLLLPTILSRCEKHKVQLSDNSQSLDWLSSMGIDTGEELNKLYWDRPMLLRDIANDEGLSESLQWLKDLHQIHSLRSMPGKLLEQHYFVLDWMNNALSEMSRTNISDMLQVRIHSTWQEITQAEQQLSKQGINKSVILEKLLHSWQQTLQTPI